MFVQHGQWLVTEPAMPTELLERTQYGAGLPYLEWCAREIIRLKRKGDRVHIEPVNGCGRIAIVRERESNHVR